jgi:hypothetical protein
MIKFYENIHDKSESLLRIMSIPTNMHDNRQSLTMAVMTWFCIVCNYDNSSNLIHALPGTYSFNPTTIWQRLPFDIFTFTNTDQWTNLLQNWLLEAHGEEQPLCIIIPLYNQLSTSRRQISWRKTSMTSQATITP